MTPERFTSLAQAWGARLERWPAAERTKAEQLLAQHPMLKTVLDHEAAFEHVLDTHVVTPPSRVLAEVVRAGAPRRTQHRGRRRWIDWLPVAGWFHAGVAGLGLAGVAAGALTGVLLVSVALDTALPSRDMARAEAGWAHTAFDIEPGHLEGIDE